MRIDRLFFTVLAVPLDFAAVLAAGLVAWVLRFSSDVQNVREVQFDVAFPEYLASVALAALVTLAMVGLLGLYRFPKPEYGPFGVTLRIMLATTVTLAVVTLAMFLQQDLFGSRFLVLVAWLLATVFFMFERTALYWLEQTLSRRFHVGLRPTLVIGEDDLTERLVQEVTRDPGFGMRVVHRTGLIDIDELEATVRRLDIRAILIADPNQPRELLGRLIDYANAEHIDVMLVPNIVQALTANATTTVIAGIPVIELARTPLEGWGRVAKRTFDIVGSSLLIMFTSPIMLVTTLAILIESGRPVLFSDDDEGEPIMRIGKGNRPFRYFKFRSMRIRTDSQRYNELADQNVRTDGPLVKIVNDPRVTRVGRFIRKYSIDELPEFFLVLAGSMSLVGPRPHRPEEVEKYERHHRRVLEIKPGVTGMAQVSGRSDLKFDDEVRLDTFYIENWSIWLDIKLVLLTPYVLFFKRHQE